MQSSPLPLSSMPMLERVPTSSIQAAVAPLQIANGCLYRIYSLAPKMEALLVPILLKSLQLEALCHSHKALTAGHQGFERTLFRLRQEAYWVNMNTDVKKHCKECTVCQQSKLSSLKVLHSRMYQLDAHGK